MNSERLVDMANQISLFFESYPDRDEAIAGVQGHMKRFWDPRMREAIVAHWRAGGAGLRDLAHAGVGRLAREAKSVPSA